MTALTAFLLARIAEDEAVARIENLDLVPSDCWDGARVLAECEAKRRIIDWHGERDGCCEERYGAMVGTQRFIGCVTLMHLALPYADHPDYDPTWHPDYTPPPAPPCDHEGTGRFHASASLGTVYCARCRAVITDDT